MSEQTDSPFEQLCHLIRSQMEEIGVPGVALGVLADGEIETAGFGVTNINHPLAVTDETLFQIGSISKTFTTTLLMQLVEAGRLDLGAPVQTYLPDFRVADQAVSAAVTVRHLLTHTAGWVGDLFEDTGEGDDAAARYITLMADLEQLAPPDTVWSYNNASFYLAGHLIETVTGQPYGTVLREQLLAPLGMTRAYLRAGDVMLHRFAVGHAHQEEGVEVDEPWPLPRAAWPAGGLVCHVKDLLTYARFHLGAHATANSNHLLSAAGRIRMQTPQFAIYGERESIGLSWFLETIDGLQTVSHGGGTVGQVSQLTMVPQRNFALVILTNSEQGRKVIQAAERWALAHYLGLSEPQPSPLDDVSAADLAALAGKYSRPFADLELMFEDGVLLAQLTFKQGFPSREVPPPPAPPPIPAILCAADRLIALDGPFKDSTVDIIYRADGLPNWLRLGGRIYRRL